jgi:DNA-binding LytR/AlgR family response regulator
MKKYHIAIVEDEQQHIDHLKKNLLTYQEKHHVIFDIDCFNDGYEIIDEYKSDYDIIFLDIELVHLNGMDTAERVRKFDDHVTIIFVTNLAHFAIRGYEVNAHSFLVKPVSYFKFEREIEKALKKIANKSQQFIIVQTDEGLRKVPIFDVIYIESMKHELIINTIDGTYNLWGTLKEMEQKLSSLDFFRSNYCYLVNLARVKGIDGDYVLLDGVRLKISRSRKKDFMEALTDYFRGGI